MESTASRPLAAAALRMAAESATLVIPVPQEAQAPEAATVGDPLTSSSATVIDAASTSPLDAPAKADVELLPLSSPASEAATAIDSPEAASVAPMESQSQPIPEAEAASEHDAIAVRDSAEAISVPSAESAEEAAPGIEAAPASEAVPALDSPEAVSVTPMESDREAPPAVHAIPTEEPMAPAAQADIEPPVADSAPSAGVGPSTPEVPRAVTTPASTTAVDSSVAGEHNGQAPAPPAIATVVAASPVPAPLIAAEAVVPEEEPVTSQATSAPVAPAGRIELPPRPTPASVIPPPAPPGVGLFQRILRAILSFFRTIFGR